MGGWGGSGGQRREVGAGEGGRGGGNDRREWTRRCEDFAGRRLVHVEKVHASSPARAGTFDLCRMLSASSVNELLGLRAHINNLAPDGTHATLRHLRVLMGREEVVSKDDVDQFVESVLDRMAELAGNGRVAGRWHVSANDLTSTLVNARKLGVLPRWEARVAIQGRILELAPSLDTNSVEFFAEVLQTWKVPPTPELERRCRQSRNSLLHPLRTGAAEGLGLGGHAEVREQVADVARALHAYALGALGGGVGGVGGSGVGGVNGAVALEHQVREAAAYFCKSSSLSVSERGDSAGGAAGWAEHPGQAQRDAEVLPEHPDLGHVAGKRPSLVDAAQLGTAISECASVRALLSLEVHVPEFAAPHTHGALQLLHRLLDEVNPTPFTLHPSLYTLHPPPSNLHPTTSNLHPAPYTLHPAPKTLHPSPNPTSYTLNPTP